MSSERVPHLPLAAFLAVMIMVGMPMIARMQPKPVDDPWLRCLPPMHPVCGRVLFDGQPVAGAVVVFHTTVHTTVAQPSGSYVRELDAIVTTDKDGWFDVWTFPRVPGLVAGTHFVKIEQMVPTGRMLPMPDMHPGSGMYPSPGMHPGPGMHPHGGAEYPGYQEYLGEPEIVNRLPERFADLKTSGIAVAVTPEGTNRFEIRLTLEPPPEVAPEPGAETEFKPALESGAGP